MVAPATKIDSNVVGLSYAEETSIGTVDPAATWNPLEPNSFSDFGGSIKTVARRPINPSRQRKKGVTVDLEASGGFNSDLTATNLQDLLQGFMFASFRKKAELAVANVKQGGAEEDYEPAAGGDGFYANDLLFAKGFAAAGNNGLKLVTAAGAATVTVSTALVAAAAQTGTISRVGHQFAAADLKVTLPGGGSGPVLTTEGGGKDLTQLGLIPGEMIYIGGDAAAEQFANAANNGWARVKSIAAHAMELDKSQGTMVADAGAGKTIRIFMGRVLRNETGSSIVRRSYNLERLLGAPDNDAPSQIQSEYITGAVPNELSLAIKPAEKITADLSFIALGSEQRTGATGKKPGTRASVVESDAFNASSDVSRFKISVFTAGTSNPTALLAYLSELKITLKNNASLNKAVGVLGGFEVTAGTFEIGGSLTAYFADVAAISAVRNNSDVTIDLVLAKGNKGIAIDLPLVALGDGRPTVEADQPIMLPLTFEAGAGAPVNANADHTMLMVFFDYLPNAAQ